MNFQHLHAIPHLAMSFYMFGIAWKVDSLTAPFPFFEELDIVRDPYILQSIPFFVSGNSA